MDISLRNRAEIAKELIDHDADPNACSQAGVSPLVIATALGNYDVLKELLKSPKLNIQLRVSTQYTVRTCVCRVGMTVCDDYLHCQGAEGNTALHMAVASHRSEAVRILLEAGASPTIPNHGYFTPILEAARNGFYA